MRARLTVEPPDGHVTVHELSPAAPATLGRSRDSTVVLRDEHASRLHARVVFEAGRWVVQDVGLNGTRLNGQRIQGEAELTDGFELRIGDTRLRFELETAAAPPPPRPSAHAVSASAATAHLPADGLSALAQLVRTTIDLRDGREVLRLALPLLQLQTGAALAGYLSLDPSDPAPQLLLPEKATVPAALSRHLTRRAKREGKTIWLGTDSGETQPGDTLAPFSDALCVPLTAGGKPFGALHVYRAGSYFADRDVRFCEALAGYLAPRLEGPQARRALEADAARLRQSLPAAADLVGHSPPLQRLRQELAALAPQAAPALFLGGPGAGKELTALALHRRSPRAAGPFVSVQCAGIDPSEFAAELLGYVRGAFPGAGRDSPGLLDQAEGGSLFLDELADLPLDCQEALVGVLDGRGYRPIGGNADRPCDCRLLAATQLDPETEVAAGRLRADLFEKLRPALVRVPPLRDHREDVPALAQYFLDRLAVECRRPVKLTSAAAGWLAEYDWPGNVRELRATLEAAVARCAGDTLDAPALGLGEASAEGPAAVGPEGLRLADVEAWAIRQALAQTGNDLYRAAALLDLTPERLSGKLRQHRFVPAEAEGSGSRWNP
jgi:DNA-binding NtrC family response regulator